MAKDPELSAHLEWLGYIQPVGLVVSPTALLQAQAHINRNVIPQHQRFLSCLPVGEDDEPVPQINDFPGLVRNVLDWQDTDLIAFEDAQAAGIDVTGLEVVLPEYNETLRPTWVVPEFQSTNAPPSTSAALDSPVKQKQSGGAAKGLFADEPEASLTAKLETATELVSEDRTIVAYREDVNQSTDDKSSQPSAASQPSNASRFVMLIQQVATDQDLDEPLEESDRRWHASPHARFERLLRETQVPAGLLTNGRNLRLVYSPRGETSGYLTFNVDEMTTVAGRPIFAAFHMLLNSDRLFNLEKKQRLPAILAESRKYQNTVSTQLAQQVMAALYELLRGFQAADDQWNGRLLKDVLARDPQHVYHGLVTVLMRTVFVLYAEDRNLLSNHPVYTNYYAITGLFERLRADAGQYPDTMDQRYGAWAQLLTLFRMIYEGGSHAELQIPPRKGYLFDPKRYPFLEGSGVRCQGSGESLEPTAAFPKPDTRNPIPRVSDGVIFRVLNNLLLLDGERLSYRSLDVEQIGSVYEAIMGFEVQVATGRSIAIRAVKKHGAPATINLEELLNQKAADRVKWLKECSDQDLTGKVLELLKAAGTIDDLLAALESKIASEVTPNVVPARAMIFQPSDERRRSGSHYTPRSLTEPVVRTTLKPILDQLGPHPRPEQILALKICDPAMGSGAFLVEVCRQLAEALVAAWYYHDCVPQLPPDEDEVLYARRLIAQQCLYGVDKNIMAVDLAKLSLWLVTLAKDHPFTFLDHSLRHGDSLVGLTRQQIIGFHWEPGKQKKFGEDLIQKRLDRATEARAKILNAREDVPYRDQEQRLALADEALNVVRLTGDACVSAFFAGSKKKEREDRCEELFASVSEHYQNLNVGKLDMEVRGRISAAAASLRSGDHPIPPFHWEIEFPEVFSRENPGFDAFVGNPPFAGKNTVSAGHPNGFVDWLKNIHPNSHGNSDLVAHFFRRAFEYSRFHGTLGLIATNTIGQGDTRTTGLKWIRDNGGTIYNATKRFQWPGQASVVVSLIHISKGDVFDACDLDGTAVDRITSYLFAYGGDAEPRNLKVNDGLSYQGAVVLGMGFTFDDSKEVATPVSEMNRLIVNEPRNAERIFPYIGGSEVNQEPTHQHHRFVINFAEMSLEEARQWPDLMSIVEQKVKPERDKLSGNADARRRRKYWWLWGRYTPALFTAVRGLNRVLVTNAQASPHHAFIFYRSDVVFANSLNVFPVEGWAHFSVLQSRAHEVWTRFYCSTLEDRLRYNPTDCFDNFPFPIENEGVCRTGEEYYPFRASLMVARNEGLTDTYNRFHDPHEKSSEILHLRELHAAMDRAVLEAYGWHDLAQTARCEFLLDYEDEDDSEDGDQGAGTGRRQKKKPWRLRWPDDFRDEVLARLLELNEQRHKEELLAGKAITTKRSTDDDDHESDPDTDEEAESPKPKKTATKSTTKPKAPRKSKKSPATGQQEMDF